jgi:hypothetical protein
MRAIVLCVMIVLSMGPGDVWASQKVVTTDVEAKALRDMASAIPPGSRVHAQTRTGARINGTLMSVTGDAVIIKKKTRLPEPAVTVPFAELARLELQQSGGSMSVAKMLGVGLAAGAGAILTLFAFVAAIDD